MAVASAPGSASGVRWLGGLGRFIVRHPWYPIIFWIVLLVATVPFLSRVGAVTTNSASNLPSSAPSSVAAAQIAREFPNSTAPTDSILLVVGPNVTGPTGQSIVLALARTAAGDPNLTEVESVSNLYGAFAEYLDAQAQFGLGALQAGMTGGSPALSAVAAASAIVWAPPAAYVSNWVAYGATHAGSPPESWNFPAYRATVANYSTDPTATQLLESFYKGYNGSTAGFNGTPGCAGDPAAVDACATLAVRANEAPLVPTPGASGALALAEGIDLSDLAIPSDSAALALAAHHLIAVESGLPAPFVDALAVQFPNYSAPSLTLASWASNTSASPSGSYPIPVPRALLQRFVSPDRSAEILLVTYSVDSGYVDAQGRDAVYADVAEIGRIAPTILAATPGGAGYSFYQTGGAPLDDYENSVLSGSLAVVLPLTIVVLIAITILYFRAPLAPMITFGGLGIAIGLGLGAVVLVGTLVTHVDVTAIELEETFLLGVGTDYSIFLVARYREELQKGAAPHDAVVTSVTWAGQSVATSGATAVLATSALAFSGVALLSQWGIVLSLAILITVLISLTLVPAFLVLVGPRVFWPSTGARFQREAAEHRARLAAEQTYFFRAGRLGQRRPRTIVLALLALSVPLIILAVNVPLDYDFYGQLPGGAPATNGLAELGNHFGQGFAFPVESLVRFSSPLLLGNGTNATEFTALANLTAAFVNTSGVHAVGSPVGGGGAPLSAWIGLSTLPPATQLQLRSVLGGYLGADGRSVLLTIVPSSSGLSYSAVQLVNTLAGEFSNFQRTHPSAQEVYFGGGAPTTRDIAEQTSAATERMILVVSIGLIVVLFAVLRSWLIPLLAVGTIGLSLTWSWAATGGLLHRALGVPLFYFVPTVLFIIILGLGIDYNIFLLTRVREERLRGLASSEAVVQAVASTGGIITAAAVILASAFAVLSVGQFVLLRAIGFAVAAAVLLDAFVVRTYLMPSALHALGDRIWKAYPFQGRRNSVPPEERPPPSPPVEDE